MTELRMIGPGGAVIDVINIFKVSLPLLPLLLLCRMWYERHWFNANQSAADAAGYFTFYYNMWFYNKLAKIRRNPMQRVLSLAWPLWASFGQVILGVIVFYSKPILSCYFLWAWRWSCANGANVNDRVLCQFQLKLLSIYILFIYFWNRL